MGNPQVPPSTDFRSVFLVVGGWALEQHSIALRSFLMVSYCFAVSHLFWITLRYARNFCNIGTFPFFPAVSLLPGGSFLVFPSRRLTSSRPNISLRNLFFFWGSSEKKSSQGTCSSTTEFQCPWNKPGYTKAARNPRSMRSIALRWPLLCKEADSSRYMQIYKVNLEEWGI